MIKKFSSRETTIHISACFLFSIPFVKKNIKETSNSADFNLTLGLPCIGFSSGVKGAKIKREQEERRQNHNSKTKEAVLRKTVLMFLRSFDVEVRQVL